MAISSPTPHIGLSKRETEALEDALEIAMRYVPIVHRKKIKGAQESLIRNNARRNTDMHYLGLDTRTGEYHTFASDGDRRLWIGDYKTRNRFQSGDKGYWTVRHLIQQGRIVPLDHR